MSPVNTGSGDGRPRPLLDALAPSHVPELLSTLAFWGAIALPVVYLPLLVAGIDTPARLALFLGLFGLHVLALVGGRAHASAGGP